MIKKNKKALYTKYTKKQQKSILKIKFYTYLAQLILFFYGFVFILIYVNSVFSNTDLFSLLFNLSMVLTSFHQCERCRKFIKHPKKPNFIKAKISLRMAICFQITFFAFYAFFAGFVYVMTLGGLWTGAVVIFVFASPFLLLSVMGLCVLRNFRALLVKPLVLYKGKEISEGEKGQEVFLEEKVVEQQEGVRADFQENGYRSKSISSIADFYLESTTDGYYATPESFGMNNQSSMKKNGRVTFPPL